MTTFNPDEHINSILAAQKPTANLQRYLSWVYKEQGYEPNRLLDGKINRFRSPPAEKNCFLSLEDRAYLYMFMGFPLMLDGPTGTGKTTLVENLAVRLELPFYREEGREKLGLIGALVTPHIQNGNTVNYPGQLTQAALNNGIFFLEECANIDPDKFVEFHSVLQGKQVTVPTQFGSVPIDLSEVSDFRIAAAGNFSYQRPNFSIATLQRFVWMTMPYMTKKDFAEALQGEVEEKGSMDGYATELDALNKKFKELYTDAKVTVKNIAGVAQMLASIREKASSDGLGFDQNPGCYKRAMRCYTPGLTLADYQNILLETVIHPIAAKDLYLGREKKVERFREIANSVLHSHQNLFEGKQTQARAATSGILGRFKLRPKIVQPEEQ